MAETVKVKVLRHLLGDKAYQPGDKRDLTRADAERLAASGAVEIVGGAKKERAPSNKKEAAPANKALSGIRPKKGE